jgi:hypothetical protein
MANTHLRWADIAMLLSRGESASAALDANARAVLSKGIGDIGAEPAQEEGAWVRCGNERLKLQASSPAPHSLVRGMPFLFIIPPARMEECGIRPRFIGSDEVLDGCAAPDRADDRKRAGAQESQRTQRLRSALCECAVGRPRSSALRELMDGPLGDAGSMGPEALHLLCSASPGTLERLMSALATCGANAGSVAQFAQVVLRTVLPRLAMAARPAAHGVDATALPGYSPAAPLAHELQSLFRSALSASGALSLSADEFALFLEMTEDCGLQRTGLEMHAVEIYLEHAAFGRS